MPTSGDLKSGDSLFSTTYPPPSQEIQWAPPPPHPDKYGNDKGHYMRSYMKYILSKFVITIFMPEIIFVND